MATSNFLTTLCTPCAGLLVIKICSTLFCEEDKVIVLLPSIEPCRLYLFHKGFVIMCHLIAPVGYMIYSIYTSTVSWAIICLFKSCNILSDRNETHAADMFGIFFLSRITPRVVVSVCI